MPKTAQCSGSIPVSLTDRSYFNSILNKHVIHWEFHIYVQCILIIFPHSSHFSLPQSTQTPHLLLSSHVLLLCFNLPIWCVMGWLAQLGHTSKSWRVFLPQKLSIEKSSTAFSIEQFSYSLYIFQYFHLIYPEYSKKFKV